MENEFIVNWDAVSAISFIILTVCVAGFNIYQGRIQIKIQRNTLRLEMRHKYEKIHVWLIQNDELASNLIGNLLLGIGAYDLTIITDLTARLVAEKKELQYDIKTLLKKKQAEQLEEIYNKLVILDCCCKNLDKTIKGRENKLTLDPCMMIASKLEMVEEIKRAVKYYDDVFAVTICDSVGQYIKIVCKYKLHNHTEKYCKIEDLINA